MELVEMVQPSLIEMTTEIVAAHVSNNSVAVGDVSVLVRSVHEALASVEAGKGERQEEKKAAVVSIRSSVKPDHITCLLCGRKQKTMKRHLQVAHGMNPDQYRAEFDLPKAYPMVAPEYSQRRGDLARRIGLGRKPDHIPALSTRSARSAGRPSKSTQAPAPKAKPGRPRKTPGAQQS
jgi:predicted transcriptional regulator